MANQHTKKNDAKKAKARSAISEAAQLDEALAKLKKGVDVPIRINMTTTETPLMNKCDEKAKRLPHFTLLPSDNFTPVLVKHWIALAVQHGAPEEKVLEARQILKRIELWRAENPTSCKTPD